jgi:hypothetical protein
MTLMVVCTVYFLRATTRRYSAGAPHKFDSTGLLAPGGGV